MKKHFNTDVKFHEQDKTKCVWLKAAAQLYTQVYDEASLGLCFLSHYILVLSIFVYTLYYKEVNTIQTCLNWLSPSEAEPRLFHGFILFQALGPMEVLSPDITNIYKQKAPSDKCLEVPFLWIWCVDD